MSEETVSASRPSSRMKGPDSLLSSLEDIPGFRGIRATAIQDNNTFWKRVLTAYETEARKEFNHHEAYQHDIRLNRIKSAPANTIRNGAKERDDGKLLPRRCVSEQGYRSNDMSGVKENRAAILRSRHIEHLHSLNAFSAITRMQDYQHTMRHNRPSHSARYPRFISNEKLHIDPEWGEEEYDVYIFHCKSDTKWVSKWLRNLLEAKRFNVKMRANATDLQRHFTRNQGSSRLIFVLTPDFIRRDFSLLENLRPNTNALAIRLKPCVIPVGLNFNCYIDLSFKDMTDMTLQSKLLPKLISTLQLPRSICS